jgi:hypothetical protein
MSVIVKQILGHHVTFGGESHSGWLPGSAATPLPTPAFDIALNIAIEFDGSSYFLRYASEDGSLVNDNWYQTLEEAEQAAVKDFGVRADQWQTIG